ncbi:hypothetical protein QBC43DRAFT_323938 [Cladorrhinum sp. PSN259]|nr:hypothetical protein QBC43DRAFT_323938 [Cladorrhinum sp. PSN259]
MQSLGSSTEGDDSSTFSSSFTFTCSFPRTTASNTLSRSTSRPTSSQISADIALPSIDLPPTISASSVPRTSLPDVTDVTDNLNLRGLGFHSEPPGVGSSSRHSLSPSQPDGTPRGHRHRRSASRDIKSVHEVADEQSPDDPFHNPAFQKALSDARTLISRVSGALGTRWINPEEAPTLYRLHQRAQDLANFRCAVTQTVAFVGDSGVGKSSVLNSLLDVKGLAPASSGGSACTCVATEYRFHDSQTFTIQVTPFTEDELRTQLSGLVQSYQYWEAYQHSPELGGADRKLAEEQYKLASDTFQAMFRGRVRMANPKAFITSHSENIVLETMMLWTRQLGPRAVRDEEHIFDNAEACSSMLSSLNSEDRSIEEPSSWPYIKKISLYLNAHVLRKGLVLVDLPGLRDLNSARQQITERYLIESCDEILVVCQRSRATTDAGVAAIFKLAKSARLSNIGIICTKSDEEKPDEARREWTGSKKLGIERRIDDIDAAEEDLEVIKGDLADLEALEDDFDGLTQEERDEYSRLGRKCRDKEKSLKLLNFELSRYLITIRNEWVISELKTLYQPPATPDSELQVFCVSNSYYWDNRHEPKDKALPYLQLSGIIALRRHCVSLVSQAQLRLGNRYIHDEIPGFLGEMEMWIQAGSASAGSEQKKLIRDVVDGIQDRLFRGLNVDIGWVYELRCSLVDLFQVHVLDAKNTPRWASKAREASSEWNEWHGSQYSAWCRNYGKYWTKRKGSHNWNKKAIKAMSEDLDEPWNQLQPALDVAMKEREIMVGEVIKSALQHLSDNLAQYPATAGPINRTLQARGRVLHSTLQDLWEDFTSSLLTLRTDALSGISTSIFVQIMTNAYRTCNADGGSGSDRRRKNVIKSTLGDQSTFQSHMREVKKRFQALANELEGKVHSAVDDQYAEIKGALDIVRDENVVEESEVDLEFRDRVKSVVEDVVLEMERISC